MRRRHSTMVITSCLSCCSARLRMRGAAVRRRRARFSRQGGASSGNPVILEQQPAVPAVNHVKQPADATIHVDIEPGGQAGLTRLDELC